MQVFLMFLTVPHYSNLGNSRFFPCTVIHYRDDPVINSAWFNRSVKIFIPVATTQALFVDGTEITSIVRPLT